MQIYTDACIVMYLIERRADYFIPVQALYQQAFAQQHRVTGSELLRMECLVGPFKKADPAAVQDFENYFSQVVQSWLVPGRNAHSLAAQLRAHHNLKTPDALHLATAIDAGCEAFWTNDLRLQQAAAGRIRIITPQTPN